MTLTNELSPFLITFKLASITTILLLILGTPLAWWLAKTNWKGKVIINTIVALPLILPPTVLGFYLLLALGPYGILGKISIFLGGNGLAFTFPGLVIGSMVYSLPFVVQPLRDSFKKIDSKLLDAATMLGASPMDRFISIVLPLSKPGILTASVLGFAHTIGEFGVVLMIGGNIPGSTRVLSIAIYDHVENLEYMQAHFLSAGLLIFSFLLLLIIYIWNEKNQETPYD